MSVGHKSHGVCGACFNSIPTVGVLLGFVLSQFSCGVQKICQWYLPLGLYHKSHKAQAESSECQESEQRSLNKSRAEAKRQKLSQRTQSYCTGTVILYGNSMTVREQYDCTGTVIRSIIYGVGTLAVEGFEVVVLARRTVKIHGCDSWLLYTTK
jgi:hypothetical protein